MKSMHEEKKHECETCGKKFTVPSALKNHILEKHGEKMFDCTDCDKR